MRRLILLYSHPIQYFAPLCKALTASKTFDVLVCYCSKLGLEARRDEEFGTAIQWDIPLLEGYYAVFLKNWRWRGDPQKGFFGLINPGILGVLLRERRAYIQVHGWNYWTHLVTILVAPWLGHKICLRAESPLSQERERPPAQLRRRGWVFRRLLFPRIDYFWYIGTENREFFRHYGVPEHKLIAVPYCVDNARFQAAAAALLPQKNTLREHLGVPIGAKIILFSGKLVAKKRPLDLLQAFQRLAVPDVYLVFMGDGALRSDMEDYIRLHDLSNVSITGFINQSGVSTWYAVADLFVMCSGAGETWGLSVNEAMNFALPLVLSDLTGCARDLCIPGANGHIFPTGDVDALCGALSDVLSLPAEKRAQMGEYSRRLVAGFSYETILQSLNKNLLE